MKNVNMIIIVEKYKLVFFLTFIVMSFGMMFQGVDLFDSIIVGVIFSIFVVIVKYYGDKLLIKIRKNKKL